MMTKLKWIVMEENPKPDNYIAIMVALQDRILNAQNRPCSIFSDDLAAMERAKELCVKYNVKTIRIFTMEGYSGVVQ